MHVRIDRCSSVDLPEMGAGLQPQNARRRGMGHQSHHWAVGQIGNGKEGNSLGSEGGESLAKLNHLSPAMTCPERMVFLGADLPPLTKQKMFLDSKERKA